MDIPILFGRFLVRKGKISEEDLTKAVRVQSEINRSYAAVALESNFITLDEFKKALDYQRQNCVKFRDAILELKIASDETLEKIDNAFKEKTIKLGELLVKRGAITEDELRDALNEFKEKGVLESV